MQPLPEESIAAAKEFILSFVASSRHKAVRYSLVCDGTKGRRKLLRGFLDFKPGSGDPEIAIDIAAKRLAAEGEFILTPIDSLDNDDYLMQIPTGNATSSVMSS